MAQTSEEGKEAPRKSARAGSAGYQPAPDYSAPVILMTAIAPSTPLRTGGWRIVVFRSQFEKASVRE
ncbi:MAG TPA: hypothetical protein VGF38_15965 [Ktedonobacterales bacterium]|jgi:hypothetical protein